jgi:hypothetical protein
MGFRHVTLRQRIFHGAYHAVDELVHDPKHGHWQEYLVDVIFILANMFFVAGSVCFFDDMAPWVVNMGCWFFIVGSSMNTLLTGHLLMEQLAAKKHLTARFNDEDRHEVYETALFVVSSFIFTAGTFLFMPGIYKSEESEQVWHEVGAWSFITGSLCLVFACYYNGLGIAESRAAARAVKHCVKTDFVFKLNTIGLGMTQIGSVMFVTGSFLYRPAFASRKHSAMVARFDTVTNNGTILFLVGSLIYLSQSVLALIIGLVKHDLDDEALEAEDRGEKAPLIVKKRSFAQDI